MDRRGLSLRLAQAGIKADMSMLSRLSRLTRSPQGKRMMRKAQRYASSPEGRRKIDQVRRQLSGSSKHKRRRKRD